MSGMRIRLRVVPLLVALMAILAWPVAHAERPTEESARAAGERIFRDKNCQYCHSVEVVGISRNHESEKMRGPDLSVVGEELSTEEVLLFLKKEELPTEPTAAGPVVQETHWKTFWGTEQDAQVLAAWLVSLHEAPPEETR